MQDLVIEFTNDGSHLYEQIYRYIKDEIRKGKLLAKEKLPSTRSLAAYLQVSRSTAQLAYEQLLSEGYIESVPYKGYFVAKVEELYQLPTETEKKNPQRESQKPKYQVDFSPNGMDMEAFPFGTWRRISKNVLSQDKKETFALGSPRGDEELRTTIARYLHASRGVNCSPEQIIVGAGNDYLLLLLRYILGENVKIAFEQATYLRANRIFGLFAGGVTALPFDESGLSVEALHKSDVNAVYVMPSHQYPTGISMPIGRRMELLNWAAGATDRYIIEDDYDSEFRYKGKPLPSLQASDKQGKVIYIGTFSKSIAPAIRISFMVLPPKLLKAYEEKYSFLVSTVSRIDQSILNEFIESGAFERHLNRMRKIYKEKHDLLLTQLKPFARKFKISGENAGLHLVLTAKGKSTEEELIQTAKERGLRVYGLSEAALTKIESPATILLGFGGLTKEQIIDGCEILKEIWL